MIDPVEDATPAKYFAFPPYHAEEFVKGGASGVMNRNGVNVLTFKTRPGLTLCDYDTAKKIAERWDKVLTTDSTRL